MVEAEATVGSLLCTFLVKSIALQVLFFPSHALPTPYIEIARANRLQIRDTFHLKGNSSVKEINLRGRIGCACQGPSFLLPWSRVPKLFVSRSHEKQTSSSRMVGGWGAWGQRIYDRTQRGGREGDVGVKVQNVAGSALSMNRRS